MLSSKSHACVQEEQPTNFGTWTNFQGGAKSLLINFQGSSYSFRKHKDRKKTLHLR